MKRYTSKRNGRKGGRPKNDNIHIFQMPKFSLIILTENQYKALLKRYGISLLYKALEILENWLKTSPIGEKYIGKNNYAHFRSDGWVINSAKCLV